MSKDSKTAIFARAVALLADFQRAAGRLSDALAQPESEFIRDASIQRFEFCFELAWKSIQTVARIEALDCTSPRAAFSMAWRTGWISNEEVWLDMLENRNKTSHTYHEVTAEEVFASLPRFLPELQLLHQTLTARLQQILSESLPGDPRPA